jgi:hypothetical protein
MVFLFKWKKLPQGGFFFLEELLSLLAIKL